MRGFILPAMVGLLLVLSAGGLVAYARVAEVQRAVGDDEARQLVLWIARGAARSKSPPRVVPTARGPATVTTRGAATEKSPRVVKVELDGAIASVALVKNGAVITSWTERYAPRPGR